MRKGRYSSSGSTPLDRDVDTALKQEVERITRERSSAKKEVQPLQRSPELQAYYTGQRVKKKPDPEDEQALEFDETREYDEAPDMGEVEETGTDEEPEEKAKKVKKENEVLSIIGYALYHFVAMGLIAVCVILIYFCFKFYFMSNGKQQRTEYHYHEAGESTQAVSFSDLTEESAV